MYVLLPIRTIQLTGLIAKNLNIFFNVCETRLLPAFVLIHFFAQAREKSPQNAHTHIHIYVYKCINMFALIREQLPVKFQVKIKFY